MNYKSKNIWLKCGVICFATMTLIATGDEPGKNVLDLGGNGNGKPGDVIPDGGGTPIDLGRTPNDTISKNAVSLIIGAAGLSFGIDINNIARANTRFYDKSSKTWTRITAHALTISGSASIEGSFDAKTKTVALTKLSYGAGSPNKIAILLKSATEIVAVDLASRTFSDADLATLNADINDIIAKLDPKASPTDQIALIAPLLAKNGVTLPSDITSLVGNAISAGSAATGNSKAGGNLLPLTYKGTNPNTNITSIVSTGGSGSTSGLYGGFGIDSGGGKQFSGFYAKADGSQHIASAQGVDATYDVNFAGASLKQDKISSLYGNGKLNVDFGTGKIKTDANGISANELGAATNNKLSFELSYDAADKIFKTTTAKFTPGDGSGDIEGNAEAAIFEKDGAQSVLGSVDLRTGDNVVVGGFGNKPTVSQ